MLLRCIAAGAALIVFSASPASAQRASAPLTFCNQTSANVGLTIGYHTPGVNDPADHSLLTGLFVSDGWYSVEAAQCQTFPNKFGARYMFWFAFSSQYNNSYSSILAGRNDNDQYMCATNYLIAHADGKTPEFVFESENVSRAACDDQADGAADGTGKTLWIGGKSVDTWVNATVNFTGQ